MLVRLRRGAPQGSPAVSPELLPPHFLCQRRTRKWRLAYRNKIEPKRAAACFAARRLGRPSEPRSGRRRLQRMSKGLTRNLNETEGDKGRVGRLERKPLAAGNLAKRNMSGEPTVQRFHTEKRNLRAMPLQFNDDIYCVLS
ncbi:unnamed protein product, partial [Iphiclides podalirius]